MRYLVLAALMESLQMRAIIDDGFVAFLNGEKIASFQAPDELNYSSRASGSRLDSAVVRESSWPTFDLASRKDLLNAYQGDNNGKYPSIESNDIQIEGLDNWVSELVVAANPDLEIEEVRMDPQTKIFVSSGLKWETPTGINKCF